MVSVRPAAIVRLHAVRVPLKSHVVADRRRVLVSSIEAVSSCPPRPQVSQVDLSTSPPLPPLCAFRHAHVFQKYTLQISK